MRRYTRLSLLLGVGGILTLGLVPILYARFRTKPRRWKWSDEYATELALWSRKDAA